MFLFLVCFENFALSFWMGLASRNNNPPLDPKLIRQPYRSRQVVKNKCQIYMMSFFSEISIETAEYALNVWC